MESKAKKYKRVLEGIVVSDKMDKTIVVKVESKQKHPLYGKTISKNKRLPSILTSHIHAKTNKQTATITAALNFTNLGGISPMICRIFSLLNSIFSSLSIAFIFNTVYFISFIRYILFFMNDMYLTLVDDIILIAKF